MDRCPTVVRPRASRDHMSLHSTAPLLPRHSRSSPPIVHPARGTLLEPSAIVVWVVSKRQNTTLAFQVAFWASNGPQTFLYHPRYANGRLAFDAIHL